MSASLSLTVEDPRDPAVSSALDELITRAGLTDAQPPFSDQSLVDARSGSRALHVARRSDTIVVAAIVGGGELEFVVDPASRGTGLGRAALEQLLVDAPDGLLAWAHGDHPAARALAASHGFTAVRSLLHLALEDLGPADARAQDAAALLGDGSTLSTGADLDVDEWVALNAIVFASHPEQGRMTADDVEARRSEPWFDAGDLLLVRDAGGALVAYNWLKLEPGAHDGEIYVIGVSPDAAGHGLGRSLMLLGLERMRERGRTGADLYVEAENTAAVRLYRSLGFTDVSIDVQYLRDAAAPSAH